MAFPNDPHLLIADSGASQHSVNNLAFLTNVRDTDYCINTADGTPITATQMGALRVRYHEKHSNDIHDVYFLPTTSTNLLSLGRFDSCGHTVTIGQGRLTVTNASKSVLVTGTLHNGVYHLDLKIVPPNISRRYLSSAHHSDATLIHRRFGHASLLLNCPTFNT
jgi:hypothetical protein